MYLDNETVLESGNYRVKAYIDYDPVLPEGDVYAPQFMVPITSNQRADLLVNIDQGTATYLTKALKHFEYDVDTFKRWAKLFHNVNANIISTSGYAQGELSFIIVWPDQYWLDTVGLDSGYIPDCGDVADLASYIWGDVFTLVLERHTEWFNAQGDVMATYDEIDAIGGIYANQGQGDDYVKEVARELLESNIT